MIVENDCMILQHFKMGGKKNTRARDEAQWVQANREELVERIA